MAESNLAQCHYLEVWGEYFRCPAKAKLMRQVAIMDDQDAAEAKVVVGIQAPLLEPTVSGPTPEPRPLFKRTHMPPPPGATDD